MPASPYLDQRPRFDKWSNPVTVPGGRNRPQTPAVADSCTADSCQRHVLTGGNGPLYKWFGGAEGRPRTKGEAMFRSCLAAVLGLFLAATHGDGFGWD